MLDEIKQRLPKDMSKRLYCEPFIGGGALLFALQPSNAIINDINDQLINTYRVIKEQPEALIDDLSHHENTAEYFYTQRALDRTPQFQRLTPVQHASRVLYLNKTCYNGMYRVNSAGEFNVPFGRYKNPNIINAPVIRAVSNYLNTAKIQILNTDYAAVLSALPHNAFVYLDPPYHPVSNSSNFTGYVKGGWTENDQIRLKCTCDALTQKGIPFLLSNSACDFIRNLYTGYTQETVMAARAVNSVGSQRGEIEELMVNNYALI